MKILVTGTAGFIGHHLAKALVERGDTVVGIDNINDYYDVELKYARLADAGISRHAENWYEKVQSETYPDYSFIRMNLEDRERLMDLFKTEKFDKVVNLAAQAGVRYSIENPHTYVDCNIVGFLNILEACRHNNIKHLVYASSSSVYGNNKKMPLSTSDNVDHPISLYAATKKSNELMAHTYSHLYNISTTGLRFFTVYGPWGRPDMAMFLFTDAILNDRPIKVFNGGDLYRDFTYIDDIINGIISTLITDAKKTYSIYNIGNSKPVKLTDFIEEIEIQTGEKAIKEMYPMQPGDVEKTWADVEDLKSDFNYLPKTSIDIGVERFLYWYNNYYCLS
ncbi:NAD-dependent epimerase [Pontixanthobacter gangjinensis]|uniref:NAD-dependent epimerase n=1 Tax=Christiangramia aestuarii TaxID=1028746 RepID=A0A7K1LNH7_9FLAO|nr:NAD-dependent epimerase [Christiangramia aestuarii]MUP42201.1 NAD-dependent epimerase [Christiangramia aestuarii]